MSPNFQREVEDRIVVAEDPFSIACSDGAILLLVFLLPDQIELLKDKQFFKKATPKILDEIISCFCEPIDIAQTTTGLDW